MPDSYVSHTHLSRMSACITIRIQPGGLQNSRGGGKLCISDTPQQGDDRKMWMGSVDHFGCQLQKPRLTRISDRATVSQRK